MANQINNEDQEINLTHLSRKVKSYFSRVNDSFFDGILFIKRNIIIIAVLIIAGAGYGYYKDSISHRYKNKIFVIPNFSSVDYLYKEIEYINYKLRQGDADFVKETGINKSQKLAKLEIEPVVDIYNFLDNPDKENEDKDRTFQLFRLISENGDIDKIMENEVTSRHYKSHLLTITTFDYASAEEDIKPVLDYLNANPYYKKMQEESINNLNLKIAANDTVIKQIDGVLNEFSKNSGQGANLILNDNAELNEVIKQKDKLTREQGRNRIDKVNFTKIIKDSSMTLNMKDFGITQGTMKYFYPIVLLLLFVVIARFISYYKNQVNKRKVLADK